MLERASPPAPGFRVEIRQGPQEVANAVAELIAADLRARPTLTLGLPTGSTALPVYSALIEAHAKGQISFAQCSVFAVDEYLGLSPDDPRSYAHFLRENLLSHIDLPLDQFHIPCGCATDPQAEAARFAEVLLARGGFDSLFLGLGRNGHLAFNEPGTSQDAATRSVRLDQATLAANSRFFRTPDEQPSLAITIGLAEIMSARRVIVAATGSAKAPAVAAILASLPVADWPASILAGHRDACLILDQDAAGQDAAAVTQ